MGRAKWGRIGRGSAGKIGGAGYVAVEKSGIYSYFVYQLSVVGEGETEG